MLTAIILNITKNLRYMMQTGHHIPASHCCFTHKWKIYPCKGISS